MLAAVIQHRIVGVIYQAVRVRFDVDQIHYEVISVQKKKNTLTILDSFATFEFETVVKKLQKNAPVLLSFLGQGVISKKIADSPNYQSKLLFNANLEDFYWYELRQNGNIYASVARKALIDQQLEQFKAAQLYVVDYSIGPFVAICAKPLLEQHHSIGLESVDLLFKGAELVDFTRTISEDEVGRKYSIGNEVISSAQLPAFATVLNHLFPNPIISYDVALLGGVKEEFKYHRMFHFFGIFTLGFFFITLLFSYLLLGYYQRGYQDVQAELSRQNVAYEHLISLKKDKQNKEAILRNSGLGARNFLSYYINAMASEVPSDMNLELLSVFPSQGKIKEAQRIEFESSSIVLHGVVRKHLSFNTWIAYLKRLKWVKNLEIIDFRKRKSSNAFKIKITVQFDV